MQSRFIKKPVLTLTSGPVQGYPEVLLAMAKPLGYDYDPSFLQFYETVALKCAEAMRWPDPALIIQAEPAVAIEAAAASLIARQDTVLNLASGVYGKGFGYWSARYHKDMVEIEVPYNAAISPDAVAQALRDHPEIAVVSVVHHDTPSGTINPLNEIGKVVHEHGALLLVDAVSSFGGMDVFPADCHADVFITGPGKCLGGTPGVTMIAVSPRAWAHIEANPDCPTASILSLKDWRHAWSKDKPFPFTPSVAEIAGLEAAIDLHMAEGAEAVWARHALTAKACRAGAVAMGCALWPASEEIASPTTTTITVPDGMNDKAIIAEARNAYGVMLSMGRGDTMGKLIRVGHMGPTAEPIYAVVALTALGGALNRLGFPADVPAGVAAAMAVIDGAGN